jgi:uncharacterized protein (DUF305 family)
MYTFKTRLAGALLAGTAAVTLAACGSSSSKSGSTGMGTISMPATSSSASASGSTSASAAASHSQADVSFATDMIPHHGQAIEMADMALKQASSSQVKQLASQIKSAQDPEISTMSGWLKDWGAPVPSASMSGMAMGGMSMNGMMSAEEMKQLAAAGGAAFDKLWLQMMIKHHQGAIAMAKTELTTGQYPPAKTLAQSISDSQAKEIATMQGLLSSAG